MMKRISIPLLAALLLMGPAMSQESPAGAAARQPPPVTRDIDPNSLLNGAGQVVAMVDAGQLVALYDGASSAFKRVVPRQAFVDGVNRMRQTPGTPYSRTWMRVSRRQETGTPTQPAGVYMTVEFTSTFSNNRYHRELVDFRQDEDGMVRLSGYVLE
jgi:hypothetical protein